MAATTGHDKDFMIPDAISCLLCVTKTCPLSGSDVEGRAKGTWAVFASHFMLHLK